MKQLSNQHKQLLEQPISKQEVEKTVKRLKTNKSPGLDVLMAEFYKSFRDQLIPHLLNLFRTCLEKKGFPQTWREAKLVLIPKEEKDPAHPDAYKPISLLNPDYNILTSIPAERQNECVL